VVEVGGGGPHRFWRDATGITEVVVPLKQLDLLKPVSVPAVVAQDGPDIHVKVGAALYSVPWRFIGAHLDARASHAQVQLFSAGELVKTHITASAGTGRPVPGTSGRSGRPGPVRALLDRAGGSG